MLAVFWGLQKGVHLLVADGMHSWTAFLRFDMDTPPRLAPRAFFSLFIFLRPLSFGQVLHSLSAPVLHLETIRYQLCTCLFCQPYQTVELWILPNIMFSGFYDSLVGRPRVCCAHVPLVLCN